MRPRRPPVRGSSVARNAGPSRKPSFQQDEVVPRTELIGYLDKPNQRLLTGQDPWPVNGHPEAARAARKGYVEVRSVACNEASMRYPFAQQKPRLEAGV